jgi:hypothetical protein
MHRPQDRKPSQVPIELIDEGIAATRSMQLGRQFDVPAINNQRSIVCGNNP